MTVYDPCDLHEITNCSTCSGLDKKLEQEEWTPPGVMIIAQHPGKCPRCGEHFDRGAVIEKTDAGWSCCR